MSQSVMMIGVAVVLFFTFIFVIIPNFFNFITNFLDSSTPFQETDDIPPQIPIISAPVSATNSAELKITGFGEPESFVVFVLNGAKEDKVTITQDGSFEVPLTLSEGENKISAYSVDKADNESAVTKEYITVFDAKPPSIEVTEPADGSSFETRANQSITIKGKTDADDPGIKIYISGRLVFPKDDGSFSYVYRLNEGENKLEIIAQDKAGNSNKTEVTYAFRL
ncbi:MAG: hypothetical protein BroJett025_04020 [Patescibacteria group bacterium]|nr:MAG: hypothetical protein BroJett025_04020 [Patescibacteria group bacterium]